MPNIPVTWRAEQTVNTVTAGTQSRPDIIQLANGNILVAWTSSQNSGVGAPASNDLIGRIYDPLGNPVTAEFLVNSFTSANDENDVSLAARPDGGFVAVYEDVSLSTGVTSIRLQTYSASGTPLASTTVVADFSSNAPNYSSPQVAVSSATSMLITYRQTTSPSELVGRIYDVTTDSFSPAFRIAFIADDPSITVLSNGNYVVAADTITDIVYSVITPTGTVLLSTTVTGTAGSPVDRDPSVAAFPAGWGGGFVIVWERDTSLGAEIAFRRYDAAGVQVGEGAFANAANFFKAPVVEVLPDGTFIIAYRDPSANAMVAHHFSNTGTSLGAFSFAGAGSELAATTLADGRLALAWQNGAADISLEILDTRDGPNNPGVYGPEQWQVGTIGNDNVFVDGNSEIIHFWDGDDRLFEDFTFEGRQYYGDAGNDTLIVNSAIVSDRHDGGAGIDTIDWSASTQSGQLFDLDAGVAATSNGLQSEIMVGFENVIGTQQRDIIIGSSAANRLEGLGGDDDILGEAGDDVVIGGEGNDELSGFTGNDILDGGPGNDVLNPGAGTDTLNGGAGVDTADYRGRPGPVVATIGFGSLGEQDTFNSIENIIGTSAGDFLFGDSNANELDGRGGDDTLEGGPGADVLRGGTGVDIASYADRTMSIVVDLESGGASDGDTLIDIEGLYGGSGNDILIGNFGSNYLDGRGGDDVLAGVEGADSLIGGTGVDIASYLERATAVTVNLAAGTNSDGDFYSSIEGAIGGSANDLLIGDGNANQLQGAGGNDQLRGESAADILDGGVGDDLLDGGTGNDLMTGGAGDNDWFVVRDAGDLVFEGAAEGVADRVFAYISWTLNAGAYVEALGTYNQTATDAINLTGNALNQTLYGNAGANLLDGGGGIDTMVGYEGDDWFVVRGASDRVYEEAGQGTDRVFAYVSWTLNAGSHVETLGTYNQTATDAIDLTGNELAQTLYGNAGNNILDGGGGIDTMVGYGGDDWFVVRDAADRVYEESGQGADRVFAYASWTLNAGSHVETLSTYNQTVSDRIDLTGNEIGQTLIGNAGFNILDGGGGGDVMVGLGDDDWYVVRVAADEVQETVGGGGTDRVFAYTSWTLNAGSHVEIMATYNATTTDAIDLTGNDLGQTLFGNAAGNRLDGKGGMDGLYGDSGADIFAFTAALGVDNVDIIYDFEVSVDKIAFAGISPSQLVAGAFRTGSSAQDADDRIIYDPATGALYYDGDGNGAGAQIQFATLNGAPPITASDFATI